MRNASANTISATDKGAMILSASMIRSLNGTLLDCRASERPRLRFRAALVIRSGAARRDSPLDLPQARGRPAMPLGPRSNGRSVGRVAIIADRINGNCQEASVTRSICAVCLLALAAPAWAQVNPQFADVSDEIEMVRS